MKASQLTVAVYAVLTFASGTVVGLFGHRLYVTADARTKSGPSRSPDEYRRHYVEEMRSRVKLSDQQVANLNLILDSTRDRFRQLREKERPEVKAIQDDQVARIRALLNPEQLAEYQKMRDERDRKIREHKEGSRKH